jgi:hypothetical protein
VTLFEAQAAAPILSDIFGDAEVRKTGGLPIGQEDYSVRVYLPLGTVDVATANHAGNIIAAHIKKARQA